MAGLYALLWWYVATLLLGCLLAFVLPLRRLWLILPFVLLALPFFIPLFRESVVRSFLLSGLMLLGYVVSWTAGVYAGTGVRRRLLNNVRAAYRKLGGNKGAT